MSALLEAALGYAKQGRRVHPCRADDKRPYIRWGTAASTIEADIVRWWTRWPDALLAVCTGDGLVVVDDDRGLADPDPDLSNTLTARTRSRGFHHYYSTTQRIGNAVGLLPGIDIRGEGGYVIAPPSPGWEWINDAHYPVEELPDYIYGAWNAVRRTPSRFGPGFEPRDRIAEGGRNDYIARFAGYAIRLGFDDEAELLELCLDHNAQVCVPPLDDIEVKRTARSILRRHDRA